MKSKTRLPLFTHLKRFIRNRPIIGPLVQSVYQRFMPDVSFGSVAYWRDRYESGGNSGLGSYGILAQYKAGVLNQFVAQYKINSVIEFGCGDGNQLSLAQYPKYIGFDISPHAIAMCQARFHQDETKTFKLVGEYAGESAELALSLDVVYHVVEDDIFVDYMKRLFQSARRYVIVYSSNYDQVDEPSPHVRHRCFTDWISSSILDWQLIQHIPNQHSYEGNLQSGSGADFFVFAKITADGTCKI